MACTGQAGSQAPQSMQASGSMYSIVSASKVPSSLRGWMQSTGQTSTQAVSFVFTHGSAITYVILMFSLTESGDRKWRHCTACTPEGANDQVALISAGSLRPAPDRLDLIVVAHERNNVSREMPDEGLGHLGLIRVNAVLRRRLPRPQDGDFPPDVAIRENHLGADMNGAHVHLGGIEHPHSRDLAGQLAYARR